MSEVALKKLTRKSSNGTGIKRIFCYLPDDWYEAVRREANRMDVTASSFYAFAIVEYVKSLQSQPVAAAKK